MKDKENTGAGKIETDKVVGTGTIEADKNLSPATGDGAPINVCAMLAMLAGLSCLTLFSTNRVKIKKKM